MVDMMIKILFGIVIVLIPFFLQFIICKKFNNIIGLCLPILSILISILFAMNVRKTDGYGSYILFIAVLLISNIPTMLFYLIYRYFKNKYSKKYEIEKMKLKDL